jgi:hypothetical protein
LLTEDDVIDSVCRYLKRAGWRIDSCAKTTERGYDIAARLRPALKLFVEAKGETSNRASSARYGKPFSSSQFQDHVAKAFYSAAASIGVGQAAAIALPDNKDHRKYIDKVQKAIKKLGIWVFWVASDRRVSCTHKVPGRRG